MRQAANEKAPPGPVRRKREYDLIIFDSKAPGTERLLNTKGTLQIKQGEGALPSVFRRRWLCGSRSPMPL